MSDSSRLKTTVRSKIEDVGDRLAEQAGRLVVGTGSFAARDTIVQDSGMEFRLKVRVDVERIK